MNNRATQSERILALLRSREWVDLPTILDLRIANYRARLSELRAKGYVIWNRKEEGPDGVTHSWYKLSRVNGPNDCPEALAPVVPRQPVSVRAEQQSLFV